MADCTAQLWSRLRIGGMLGLVLLVTGPARAAQRADVAAPYSLAYSANYSANYIATWAGLPAARIRLVLRDGTRRYDDEIDIETLGLPRFFTRFRGTAVAEGRRGSRIPATPWAYDAIYDLRKQRNSHISMRFVTSGGALVVERGPGDTSDKPPLARQFRTNAVDPLSALERIRDAIAAARAKRGPFVVPVYDGARRFNVIGHFMPQDRARPDTLRLDLTLQPIAGFKNRPGASDPENAPRRVELVVTNDERSMPLWLSVPVWYLPLTVRLDPRVNDR